MSISNESINNVKKYDVYMHREVVYLYIVKGIIQDDIKEELGIEDGWNYASNIIKAYNFNKTKGGSRGKYKSVSKELVYEFIDKNYPGFVDDEDDSITFDDFLKERGRSNNPASSTSRRVRETISSYADENTYYDHSNNNPYTESNRTRTSSNNSSDFNPADSGPFTRVLGVIGLVVFLIYFAITKFIIPAVDVGVFNLTTMFQKEVKIQQTQGEDNRYIGELGLFKKPKGYGVIHLDQSKLHIGKFKGGTKEGEGIQIFEDGTIEYLGNFSKDKYDDFGLIVYSDVMYIGEIDKGQKHGMGFVIDSINGIIEIVEFKQDNIIKEHAIIDQKTRNAQILNDSQYWTFPAKSGATLVGTAKGTGLTLDLASDYAYFGMYKKGEPDGYGIRVNANGNIEYGIKDGKSTKNAILYIDGEGVTLGDFKKQTKEGYGMEYMFTGEIYIGNYKKSHRHGKGTYMFLDGTTQEVKYKDGNLQ